MGIKFELVDKYKDSGLALPVRQTANSAGYDLTVAEDIVIPAYIDKLIFANEKLKELYPTDKVMTQKIYFTLSELADFTKKYDVRPTLVSTGVKCKLEPDTYLELSVRSSTPLKYWLVLANGNGIIDSDYYGNSSNDGEIFLQLINFSPVPIQLKKGDVIGQGIIKHYLVTENDAAAGERNGGFGSTSE